MPEDNNNHGANGFISTNKDINVEEIMASIKKRIQEKKDSGVLRQAEIDEIEDMELLPLPDFLEIPNVYEPHLYPEHKAEDFQPFHTETEVEAGPVKKILGKIRGLLMPLLRFMLRPFVSDLKNLTVELHNLNKEDIHNLKQTIPITFQSKEYIKLLHNVINNMIVESSKLKIEEELLKTKLKVLEDKIEFLENRERAIEKKLFTETDREGQRKTGKK
jgi:hypothetical protein